MEYVLAFGISAAIFGAVTIAVVWLLGDRQFRVKAGPIEIEAQEPPKKRGGKTSS